MPPETFQKTFEPQQIIFKKIHTPASLLPLWYLSNLLTNSILVKLRLVIPSECEVACCFDRFEKQATLNKKFEAMVYMSFP